VEGYALAQICNRIPEFLGRIYIVVSEPHGPSQLLSWRSNGVMQL
jgi:hypothetical protein